MKAYISYCSILFFLFGCASIKESRSGLVGVWKSDEAKTIKSMRQIKNVTDKARVLFENNFFGHLVVEYRSDSVRVYFDNEEYEFDKSDGFRPYELVSESSDAFVVKDYEDECSVPAERVLHREGNCYWVVVTGWKFREYFCRFN